MLICARLTPITRYEWLPRGRHMVGTSGAVNWNDGLHSKLSSKLNKHVSRAKGNAKSVKVLKHPLTIAYEERWIQPSKSVSAAY